MAPLEPRLLIVRVEVNHSEPYVAIGPGVPESQDNGQTTIKPNMALHHSPKCVLGQNEPPHRPQFDPQTPTECLLNAACCERNPSMSVSSNGPALRSSGLPRPHTAAIEHSDRRGVAPGDQQLSLVHVQLGLVQELCASPRTADGGRR